MKKISLILGVAFFVSFSSLCRAEDAKQSQSQRAQEFIAFAESIKTLPPEARKAAIVDYRAKHSVVIPTDTRTKEQREAQEAEALDKMIANARKQMESAQGKSAKSDSKNESNSASKAVSQSAAADSRRLEQTALHLKYLEMRRGLVGKEPKEKMAAIQNWRASADGKRQEELSKQMSEESKQKSVEFLKKRIAELEGAKSEKSAQELERLKFALSMQTATPEERQALINARMEKMKKTDASTKTLQK